MENGVLYYNNDNIKFKGIFKDDNYQEGILYYYNCMINFKGLFIEQQYKKGILYDKEGFKKYEGEFTHDQYNGNGILYYDKTNRIIYNGLFENKSFIISKLYNPKEKII